jgi:hypothetical protein
MATRTEQIRELDRLLSKQEARIRQAFGQYVVNTLQADVLDQIVDALLASNVGLALEILRPHVLQLSNVLPVVYTDAGVDMAREIVAAIPSISVGIGFDPSHPRAVEQMRMNKLQFVQQVTEQQRDMIRNVMQRSFQEGFGPRKVSTLLKESIGLTARQQQAVQNFRALLENRDSRALSRDLRDRRFDRTIERAIRDDKPLSQDQIDKMVKRYHERYIQYRTETIARTDGVRATNQARSESIQQMIEETGLDPSAIRRKWNRTNDGRTRDWHRSMQDQTVGMDEPFEDGKGNKLMFPGDPSAPGETTINCRCVITISQES